ncbi:MAG: hypothetical protein AAGA25_05260, partial [Planctomycetota bacterium]
MTDDANALPPENAPDPSPETPADSAPAQTPEAVPAPLLDVKAEAPTGVSYRRVRTWLIPPCQKRVSPSTPPLTTAPWGPSSAERSSAPWSMSAVTAPVAV